MSDTPDMPENGNTQNLFDFDRSKGNFSFPERHKFDAGYGLTEATIDYICDVKDDPEWVRQFRKNALAVFESKPMPTHWASPDIKKIDFSQIRYYLSDGERPKRSWDDVPEDVKSTFERLGVPEQERQFLAGVEAQYDSESAYSNMKEELRSQGVIFVNSTEGLKHHEDVFRPWFGKVIPTGDNKFSALNSAVFSGGSFIYVPKGVKLKHPLQAYFRINSENFGQFERTLIIADEGAELMYMEGCTAPQFETSTLHSAVVELVALKGAKIQYVTVQNWSSNVFNMVTKRGLAMEDAEIRWIDCNIGSGLTMKYPAQGQARARGSHLHRPGKHGPASRYGGQNDPCGGRHYVQHRFQIHQHWRRARQLPGPGNHGQRAQGLQKQHGMRRPSSGGQQPYGHLPRHHGKRGWRHGAA